MALKLRRNDSVVILTGKDKGKTGIIKNILSLNQVIVKGLNLIKKHQKPVPSQNKSGGIIEKEAPIHISNIAILNPESNKADRIGFRFEEGRKVRFFKSTGKTIQ
ncbi:50S ribosomal protein L24 [Buchnera aphidicola str. APS (Acyrthosiphon pisum)]|uniref:Large ribosomal subunit protein uL24 n=3 Tax=Buchnera aphidicola TaxID=9 RepID=RL24_BUCAI|nr:50S ribosomal protein L24 [Buchnera aphidicola]B8D838.1 RecName: Full=Large ribosomal subunit protein uL24; AltName: Full=50S ribosomal protein L24 [Buchnera aphidicola str. Tuc7 (Acyrthosiphon pisum)]B8D9T6.1 RecName: Full=Large ribosomal subunit protein uL24; AltName: Full=50S ribosomal protein L24 [Buchnera aphidicola str. 5A (Acyrthosiphon pisum)]P57580.1 RecName: Full=Large ribosomal subunit protein uL24; AltName: Full=50S ribosomal protein L24 [Buchnera aphidicola str. APS (Acyrthosipho